MSDIFAKVFSVDNGEKQLLVTQDFDGDNDSVVIRTSIDDLDLKITLGFQDNRQDADNAFASFDQPSADEWYSKIYNQYLEFTDHGKEND